MTIDILATIILGSNRPDNIKSFINNIEEKSSAPQQIEIIFSVDKGDQKCISAIEEMQKTSKVTLKYLEGVRERGYFEANIHYNECLHLADKNSYFFAIFSDKLEMETQGWDEELKKYVGFFKDDFFRVRISHFKNLRYNVDLHDALTRPDNFAFHSRKFLELSGGWGDTWGPDTWVQGIVFFCELLGIKDRDIVANEINLKHYHYSDSRGVNTPSLIRNIMGHWSFIYLSTQKIPLLNFYRIALKIKIYLDNRLALKVRGLRRFNYANNFITAFDSADQVSHSMPINPAAYALVGNFVESQLKEKLCKINILEYSIRRRVEKRKKTKNKFKKVTISLRIILDKLRTKRSKGFNQFTSVLNHEEAQCDFGKIIRVQSQSDQFTIEINSAIDEEVKNRYCKAVEQAEILFPKKLIELAKEKHVTPEMLSYLDHTHVVKLLRKNTKPDESPLDDSVLAKFYSAIGSYLMNAGLQDFASEMFKRSLETNYCEDTAIISLQNLMYNSYKNYNDERIFNATKEIMNRIVSTNPVKEKYNNYQNLLEPNKILNIGYTCHFFDNETSSNLLLPILAAHDRSRVKIFIYSDQDPKLTKKETRELADVWHDIYGKDDQEFCKMVQEDQIDVLFELNGFCVRNRYRAINARPAPVQVSFYNLSTTSAVEGIDYMISTHDIKLDQRFYSEKIINKEGVYLTISPNIPRISNIAPFTKKGYITFGSFGQIHKISRQQVLLWAEILKRVENSKFHFKSNNLQHPETVAVFRKHFEDGGIEFAARVIIEGPTEYSDLIKCYEKVDIALDTYPYTGGTTTSEAILCGVPVVHLTGERFCSQHGTNYLRYFDVEELICNNEEEFINKAVALAHDEKKIIWYRENLPDLSRKSPKCDIPNYTKELEDVCFKMWHEYCANPKRSAHE